MYHTKKIGVFISHIFGYYQQTVCQGIIDKSQEYGYTTEIYTSMDGENLGTYGIGERSILRIPNYDELDGVIFASETYPSEELKEEIIHTLKTRCTCPIIEIATMERHFPAIAMENNHTAGDLTEHLITVHGCKRICYLGRDSSADVLYSNRRESYYRSAMEKHGLTIGSHDIYRCGYSSDDATSALAFFDKKGTPDAVVCYNDTMALYFMRAALSSGYRIPEDIAITGCDDTVDGRNSSPALTTVSFPCLETGTTAMELLLQMIHGKFVPDVTDIRAHAVIANSCGCKKRPEINPIFYSHALTKRIEKLEMSILGSMSMSAAFQGMTNIDDCVDLLEKYIHEIEHCKEFYLCLYADWDSISSHILEITETEDDAPLNSDTIFLKLAIKDGKRLPECSFKKNTLLPDFLCNGSNNAYVYTPLFFEDKKFGYIALAYEKNRLDYHFRLVHWLMNINQMLQSICEAKRTGLLVSRLENIYMKDALTGLYNMHGYNNNEETVIHQAKSKGLPITCFLFDLDGLKLINDTFGHNEGDFAIQVLGHALENAVQEGDVCARFSGDEFYLLTCNYSEKEANTFLDSIQKYLDNYNRLSSKKFNISVSGGYASAIPDAHFTSDQIQELFAAADKNMYKVKREKKKKILR